MSTSSESANNSTGRGARDSATALSRRTRAVELAAAGLSYDDIARELGYQNRGTAWRTVNKALERNVAQGVDDLREVEGDRLDALQAAVWDQAMAGDTTACQVVLRVIERRCRLYGLDGTGGSAPAPARTLLIGSGSR